jgi:aerobic carbon-monoxide dehydrogenase medium subunit
MRPKPFAYFKPTDLASAIRQLRPNAMIINGGQAVLATLRMRVINPKALIDIKHIAELSDEIGLSAASITIGPRATVDKLVNTPAIRERASILYEAGICLADAQIRSQGTVVGSLCWADPRANFPVTLLACDAVITAQGVKGVRQIPAASFFAGFRANSLRQEIVTSITLPGLDAFGFSAYREFSRQKNDVCLVNVAVVQFGEKFRAAAGGLGKTPLLCPHVAALFESGVDAFSECAFMDALSKERLSPLADFFGSPEFKLKVAASLFADVFASMRGVLDERNL